MRRLLVPVVLALGACSRQASPAQCDEMLARFVDMTIDADPVLQGLPEGQRAAVRAAKVQEKRLGPEFLRAQAQCLREVTVREHDCAMKAGNGNEWEACIE